MPYKDPEARRVYLKAWWEAHRDEQCAKKRDYRLTHREEEKARHQAYFTAHRETIMAYKAAWNAMHREHNRAYFRNYALKNRASKRLYHISRRALTAARARRERLEHPERYQSRRIRRRARQAGAPINDFTDAQWQEVKAAYGYCCAYCGKKTKRLTRDHITPLIANGSHTVQNIVPACLNCNSQKRTGPPPAPVQPLLLTIASARAHKHRRKD